MTNGGTATEAGYAGGISPGPTDPTGRGKEREIEKKRFEREPKWAGKK